MARQKALIPNRQLTPRERDVIRGVVAGRTNAEIANELGIGEQAVKNLLSGVYHKYYVRNRLQLAVLVLRDGLLPP